MNAEEKKKSPNIDNLLARLQGADQENSPTTVKVVLKKSKKIKKPEHEVPRGQPKSGRPWKVRKEKFSSVKKSMYRRPLDEKLSLRKEMKNIKELSKSIKDGRKQDNELKKQRRLENAERRLQNERRSEVVQVIKNPAKLKRMRKKQLRMIEKRDLSKVKVV